LREALSKKPQNVKESTFIVLHIFSGSLSDHKGLADHLGEKPKIFEEPIQKEEETTSPTQTMAKNRNNEVFPMIETNGEARRKNIRPTALPHSYRLTSKEIDTFIL